jgi:hypothetical protein
MSPGASGLKIADCPSHLTNAIAVRIELHHQISEDDL